MTQPITFDSFTPRLRLPHLFPAQAQKEFLVNEAHALLDMLLHCAVEGEAADPPAEPGEGQAWIVGDAPTGAWSGHAGQIAGRQASAWLFAAPIAGMSVFDKASGQIARYDGGWSRASALDLPSGGSTVDAEARAAIGNLFATLRAAGILPASD